MQKAAQQEVNVYAVRVLPWDGKYAVNVSMHTLHSDSH